MKRIAVGRADIASVDIVEEASTPLHEFAPKAACQSSLPKRLEFVKPRASLKSELEQRRRRAAQRPVRTTRSAAQLRRVCSSH